MKKNVYILMIALMMSFGTMLTPYAAHACVRCDVFIDCFGVIWGDSDTCTLIPVCVDANLGGGADCIVNHSNGTCTTTGTCFVV